MGTTLIPRTFVNFLATASITCFSDSFLPDLSTMQAQTASPYILSGTPKETASPTPSTARRAESTSRGEIFSPPGQKKTAKAGSNVGPPWRAVLGNGPLTSVDQLLQATSKDEVTIAVELALVARPEVTVLGEGLLVRFWLFEEGTVSRLSASWISESTFKTTPLPYIVQVSFRHVVTLDGDLALMGVITLVVDDADRHAVGNAHRAWLTFIWWQWRRSHLMGCFRHGVCLEYWGFESFFEIVEGGRG